MSADGWLIKFAQEKKKRSRKKKKSLREPILELKGVFSVKKIKILNKKTKKKKSRKTNHVFSILTDKNAVGKKKRKESNPKKIFAPECKRKWSEDEISFFISRYIPSIPSIKLPST